MVFLSLHCRKVVFTRDAKSDETNFSFFFRSDSKDFDFDGTLKLTELYKKNQKILYCTL